MVSKDNLHISAEVADSQADSSVTPSTLAGLALALILPVFVIAPLFYPGFIQTHSGYAPLWNVIDLRANLGNVVSWTPHIVTNFDPLRSDGLLVYYLAALLPTGPISAVKMVMGIGLLLGSTGMFLWLRSWLGNAGALVAALLYSYLPHQIVTVYVRGAWGEALFWGLLPWAILAATYLVTSPTLKLLPIAAVFWLALGLSQLGLTLWALLFMILLLLTVHRPQALLPGLAALIGTVIATTLYLILLPGPIFTSNAITFDEHFLVPSQLVSAHWGFGPSVSGWNDDFSLQIGLAAIGLSILTVFLWQRGVAPRPSAVSRTDRRLLFFFCAAVGLIVLQFGILSVFWNLPILIGRPLSESLSYPWQLLGLIGLCLSILGGAALWLDRHLTQLPLFGAIIVIIILSVYPYLLPQFAQADSITTQLPQAELGNNQLALLDYHFSVLTFDQTVGLQRGQTDIPLAVHGDPQPNDTLLLNVTWQPLQPFSNNLKVFVHLVDPNNNVIAQFDGQPLQGAHPTSQWIPGETILDTYPILLPADAPPGPYQAYFGFYSEATLERLSVPDDSEGRVILSVE